MKEYTFDKKDVNNQHLQLYIDGVIKELDAVRYTQIPKRQKSIYENGVASMTSLKKQLDNLETEHSNNSDIKIIRYLISRTKNKEALRIISSELGKNSARIDDLVNGVKQNRDAMNGLPSSIGIYDDKDTIHMASYDEINATQRRDIKQKYDYFGESYEKRTDLSLFSEMSDIAMKKMELSANEKYGQFTESVLEEDEKKGEQENRHIIAELQTIEEARYCIGLKIPEEVIENASKSELKKIQKYKKVMEKRLKALQKIEDKTKELVEPRDNIEKIQEAIRELETREGSYISDKAKTQILQTLRRQLEQEQLKESKIQQKIQKQSRRSGISKYAIQYGQYAKIGKMQEELDGSDEKNDQEKTYLYQEIERCNEKLKDQSLDADHRAKLEAKIEENSKRIAQLPSNTLGTETRREYQKKVEEFWTGEVDRTIHPKRKNETLLITDGTQEQRTTKENTFFEDLRVNTNNQEVTQTIPQTNVRQNTAREYGE